MADLRAQRAFACLLAIIAIAVVAQGCGADSSKTGPSDDFTLGTAAPLSGTIVCGHSQVTNVRGQTVDDPEFYILSSVNQKLKDFPDFARSAGMTTVKTCAEARAFGDAYIEYSHAHPGFDDHQPRRSIALPPQPAKIALPAQPAKMGHEVSVPKIWKGTPTQIGPIVAISAQIPTGNNVPGQPQDINSACSGTFIAKNFIATAAHCFEGPARVNGELGGDFAWYTWYNWEIDFPGPGGVTTPNPSPRDPKTGLPLQQTPLSIIVLALSIPSDHYLGLLLSHDPAFDDRAPGDFGLLYIPGTDYDGNLPAFIREAMGPVGTPGSVGSVLPISTIPPDPSWSLNDFGYGPSVEPDPSSSPTNLVLTQNRLAPGWTLNGNVPNADGTPGTGIGSDLTGFSIMQSQTAQIPTASLCMGDSGGPLIRNFTDSVGDRQVIAAVNSRTEKNKNGTNFRCGQSTQPSFDIWSRIDIETDFINNEIATFYGPNFQCTTFPDSSNPSAFATCWGSSCVDASQCTTSYQYCLNPTQNDLNSPFYNGTKPCTNGFGTDCGLTQGQCLPLPGPSF